MDGMFPCYSLLSITVIWLYYVVLINTYKFINGHFYFPNNLKLSVSSPQKYGRAFYSKRNRAGGGRGWDMVFYMGSNMKLCKEGRNVS